MVLPRLPALRGATRPVAFRRAGVQQARANLVRSPGRRTYASAHGSQKSSDLPWLIAALVVTVPSATWLWNQGPKPSEHGGGHAEEKAHGGDKEEEAKPDQGGEEAAAETEATPTDDGEKGEEKATDEAQSEGESSDEGGEGKETPPSSDDEG